MPNSKQMKYAGRSLNKGDIYTEHVCSSCDCKEHLVVKVHKTMAILQCRNCFKSDVIERPILFNEPCPPTPTV